MKEKAGQTVELGDAALERIAGALSDLYYLLYEERPLDPRASLTGNVVAFVFEGGLSTADEWFLRRGQEQRLSNFRAQFFEVVAGELRSVVADLTGFAVNYSFFGFDPATRSTHAIFVLDLRAGGDTAAEHQAMLNWSEQVRRNAVRLRAEHRETRERHGALREHWRRQREKTAPALGEPRRPSAADDSGET